MTQDEILDALEEWREKLLEAIEGLSDEQLQQPGVTGEWSVKDILFHLSMWEAELVRLLWQAAQGDRPTSMHFTQVDVDQTNAAWTQRGQDRSLEQVFADLEAVRRQTVRRVMAFSDQDLADPQRYPWLDGRPLWEWIASDSFEHEREHAAEILAWRKVE
ncbi:MAG: ClbS/DfsB family four-helix bundle protein [Anaerolineales bacterium]|nr:ClbS/DfsB family four-helix bundle protein [Anaerolineales bacterium]